MWSIIFIMLSMFWTGMITLYLVSEETINFIVLGILIWQLAGFMYNAYIEIEKDKF